LQGVDLRPCTYLLGKKEPKLDSFPA